MADKNNEGIVYSKFNSAAQEITRIHEIYNSIRKHRTNGNLTGWNFELDSLWNELGSDKNVTPADDRYITYLRNEYALANKKNRPLIYRILLRRELWLRRLQNRLGKGSAYNKESDDGMD